MTNRFFSWEMHWLWSALAVAGPMVQGGDFTKGNGQGGESIYDGAFADARADFFGDPVLSAFYSKYIFSLFT